MNIYENTESGGNSVEEKPLVTIVIATADRPRPVLDCVESWRRQVPADVHLIVVDAGREDPVDEVMLKALWPNSKVVRSDERNACVQRNMGVRQASGDQRAEDGLSAVASVKKEDLKSKVHSQESCSDAIIIFLDDDTLVNPGWWPAILEHFGDPQVAVVQGGVHSSRSVSHLRSVKGGYVTWYGVPVPCLERGPEAPRDLDWPMTTNMAVRKSVYEAVGGLDPAFVVYDEDVDFGLRVRKAGWRIVHQPAASVYHYGHRMWRPPATKQHTFRRGRNRTLMLVRNYGVFGRVWIFVFFAPWMILGQAVAEVAQQVLRTFGHAVAYCAGVMRGAWDGMRFALDFRGRHSNDDVRGTENKKLK